MALPCSLGAALFELTLLRRMPLEEKDANMKGVRKRLQTGSVVLTAITTLLVSSPHFDCLCPNGRIKPFCLTTLSNALFSKSAVCSNAASQEENDQNPAPAFSSSSFPVECSCCCAHNRSHREDGVLDHSSVQAGKAGCEKILAVIESIAVSAGIQGLAHDLPVSRLETAQATFFLPQATLTENAWHFKESGGLSPPSDLITLLQHLVI